MRQTAVDVDLSIDDFVDYFEKNKLGRLHFPNGPKALSVELYFLYRLVTGWKIKKTLVPPHSIVAVIAFGSAVSHLSFREVPKTYKKFIFFGKQVTTVRRVPVAPKDVDFLVVTEGDLTREEIISPDISDKDDYGGPYMIRGGIHLINRGGGQLCRGVQAGDTVSISALREGVPIFFDHRFTELVRDIGIEKTTLRKIFWDQDGAGFLSGWIQ